MINRTDITRRASTNRRATCIWWKLKSVRIGEKESIYKTGSKRFCKGMGKECRRRSSSRPRWHVGWTRVSCRTVHRRTVPNSADQILIKYLVVDIKEISVIINLLPMVVEDITTVEVVVDIMITEPLFNIIPIRIMSNGMASERNPINNKADGDNLRINFLFLLILPKTIEIECSLIHFFYNSRMTSEGTKNDEDMILDQVTWYRWFLSLLMGPIWGLLGLKGLFAIALYGCSIALFALAVVNKHGHGSFI